MRSERIYGLVLLLLPLVFVGVSNIMFDFNGLYGQDAHRYFQYVSELEGYLKNGEALGEFHWPILYPLAGLIVKSVFGINGALALQLLSAVSLGVSGVILFKMLKGENSQNAFFFTLVFLIFCPQLSLASVVCMSDLFSMMWVVLVWYFYFEFKKKGKVITAYNLATVGALATISRYPAFLFVVIPAGLVFFNLLSKRQWWALIMPVLFFIFCLPELAFHSSIGNVSSNYLLNHWGLENLFQSTFQTNDGAQVHRFINLVYISYPFWHPAFFLLGIGFTLYAVFKFPRGKISWVFTTSILVYLLFLGGLETQSRRFLILAFPLILVVVYEQGFGAMLTAVSKKQLVFVGFFLIIAQDAIATYYLRPYIEMSHFERKLSDDLKPYEGKVLYAFYWDISLKSYNPNFEFHNLMREKVELLNQGDLVLFNPEELEAQWQGSNGMDNWNFIHQNNQLKVLETWPNGWKLYEVQ